MLTRRPSAKRIKHIWVTIDKLFDRCLHFAAHAVWSRGIAVWLPDDVICIGSMASGKRIPFKWHRRASYIHQALTKHAFSICPVDVMYMCAERADSHTRTSKFLIRVGAFATSAGAVTFCPCVWNHHACAERKFANTIQFSSVVL